MSRDQSPVRSVCKENYHASTVEQLFSILKLKSIGWINDNVESLKLETHSHDDVVELLFGDKSNRKLCQKLALTNLFTDEDSENLFPYRWLDDRPNRLVYCVDKCKFSMTRLAVQRFANFQWKNILRFLVLNWPKGFRWRFPIPMARCPPIVSIDNLWCFHNHDVMDICRKFYKIPIRNYCLTLLAVYFDCGLPVLNAFSELYPKGSKACFK